MLNRGNRRETIFHKLEDFEAFERILAKALDRSQIHLFAYCLLPNHWHMVVSPEVDGEMGRFGQWLGLTLARRKCVGRGKSESFLTRKGVAVRGPSIHGRHRIVCERKAWLGKQ